MPASTRPRSPGRRRSPADAVAWTGRVPQAVVVDRRRWPSVPACYESGLAVDLGRSRRKAPPARCRPPVGCLGPGARHRPGPPTRVLARRGARTASAPASAAGRRGRAARQRRGRSRAVALPDGVPESVGPRRGACSAAGSVSTAAVDDRRALQPARGATSAAGDEAAGRSARYVFGVWAASPRPARVAALGYALLGGACGSAAVPRRGRRRLLTMVAARWSRWRRADPPADRAHHRARLPTPFPSRGLGRAGRLSPSRRRPSRRGRSTAGRR